MITLGRSSFAWSRRLKPLWLSVALVCAETQAQAMDLLDAYQLAINHDQTFAAATATRQSAIEALPQAMAVWFPNISATAVSQMNWEYQNVSPTYQKYNSHGYTVSVSQQLIDFNAWFSVSEAKATVNQANAVYADAAQDLMVRTTAAYFGVLQAADNLGFVQAQKALVKKELEQARARFDVGVDAISSIYNAQSSYDSLVAEEISADNALITAYQNLQLMTGVPVNSLQKLTTNLTLQAPMPAYIQAWQNFAEAHNLSLKASQFAAQGLKQSINASNANHLPTVAALGSYEYSRQNAGQAYTGNATPYDANGSTSAAGIEVTIPLFEGGAVMSKTRQAQANYAEAYATMELNHRQVLANVYQTYSSVLSGVSQVEADRQAIKSKNNALESNQAAYQAGTMTIIDVLNAISELYNAQKIYANDQYTYLQNTLKLKQLAGNLTNADLVGINRWLVKAQTLAMDRITTPKLDTHNVAEDALKAAEPELKKLLSEAKKIEQVAP